MKKFLCLLSMLIMLSSPASANPKFNFHSIHSLDEMSAYLKENFPVGSAREKLRYTFITEGAGTLVAYPEKVDTEKYIYDINLCSYYVWRWNVSADFDTNEKLKEIYINGNPVYGMLSPEPAKGNSNSKIFKADRPRPEASKGESSLAYLVFDEDGNPGTWQDQMIVGGGPSQPNPENMGKIVIYNNVESWRSIFDLEKADTIAPYEGDCKKADALVEKMKAAAAPK